MTTPSGTKAAVTVINGAAGVSGLSASGSNPKLITWSIGQAAADIMTMGSSSSLLRVKLVGATGGVLGIIFSKEALQKYVE